MWFITAKMGSDTPNGSGTERERFSVTPHVIPEPVTPCKAVISLTGESFPSGESHCLPGMSA